MVVGDEPAGGTPSFFGFRFDPADLPEEYRPPERWREYLYGHAIPGQIVDESAYVKYLLRAGGRTLYEKRADCPDLVVSRLPPPDEWTPHGWYSFNPDDPHPGRQPCFNCVKWAIMIANGLVPDFLPEVPQGRLMLILAHLRKRVR
jgi:hypothetical protein